MNLGEKHMETFEKNLKALRKSRNLSLQELATRLNKIIMLNFQKLPLTVGKEESQVLLWTTRVH